MTVVIVLVTLLLLVVRQVVAKLVMIVNLISLHMDQSAVILRGMSMA